MKILILSDIHANLSALNAVLTSVQKFDIDNVILLGDHIDYGMRPNEVIKALREFPYDISANIWGNHEKAIFDGELNRFSSERGRDFSKYTAKIISDKSKDYVYNNMNRAGFQEIIFNDKKILCVHGSLEDVFWKSISCGDCPGSYYKYNYVLSGHSHIPLYFEKFYDDPTSDMREKKKTVFINPGSIGQPRNHNPRACFAVLDIVSNSVYFDNTEYNIEFEQKLYHTDIDEFYKTRLEKGV